MVCGLCHWLASLWCWCLGCLIYLMYCLLLLPVCCLWYLCSLLKLSVLCIKLCARQRRRRRRLRLRRRRRLWRRRRVVTRGFHLCTLPWQVIATPHTTRAITYLALDHCVIVIVIVIGCQQSPSVSKCPSATVTAISMCHRHHSRAQLSGPRRQRRSHSAARAHDPSSSGRHWM